jgi:hypothetical protein
MICPWPISFSPLLQSWWQQRSPLPKTQFPMHAPAPPTWGILDVGALVSHDSPGLASNFRSGFNSGVVPVHFSPCSEEATGVRRETACTYLKAAGVAVCLPGW